MLVVAGCGIEGDHARTAEKNDIGVVTIDTNEYTERGTTTFEIRGLDRDGNDVVRYTVRSGDIDAVAKLPGTNNYGTELVTWTRDHEVRQVTRERQMVMLAPESDPVVKAFVALPSVASALNAVHVGYFPEPKRGTGEAAYTTQSCPSSYVNTSPVAGQCCFGAGEFSYYYGTQYGGGWTLHINGATSSGNSNTGVQRNRNPGVYDGDLEQFTVQPGTPCRASDGGTCSGTGCYYGPNGFARPVIRYAWTWATTVTTVNQGTAFCVWDDNWRDFPGTFHDVTGTFATGQNCPGGDSGGSSDWDY